MEENNNNENKSFFDRWKSEPKYKAKMQLLGYGILIILIIIYLNINGVVTNNSNYTFGSNNSNLSSNNSNNDNSNVKLDDSDLLKKIKDNYEFDVSGNIILSNDIANNIHYYGKSYGNNILINKSIGDIVNVYGKVGSKYYLNDNDNYSLVSSDYIYDKNIIDYMELSNLMEYLEKAELDHVIKYTNGKREYVYKLMVRDIILINKSDSYIEFNVLMENDVLTINVDYSNLVKVINSDVKELKLVYTYKNIGSVEEFKVINN